MSGAYNLPANKWVTIGAWGPGGRRLYWKTKTTRKCKWRRLSSIPWGGTFKNEHDALIVGLFGLIQVKSPETSLAASSFHKSDVDNYNF